MRTHHSLFRMTAAAAIGGLVLGPALPPVAYAQPAPPPNAGGAAADPPTRVGRLARIEGTVSFHTLDQTQWEGATINYPVTSGNAFWTEPQATAELEVGATSIVLNGQTEFDIDTLDDHTLSATSPQGEVYMHMRAVPQGDIFTITTPRGSVSITTAGRYEILAGDTDHPTTVTVVEGAAHVGGGNLALNVAPHQTATISGVDTFQGSVGPEQDDAFLTAQLNRERAPATAATYQPPPVVQQMTGADELTTIGTWTQTPDYGEVWYPPVDRTWVPYRQGHWAWVAPWGWTWVDDAAWGFAPFHYGRWAEVQDRWAWIPLSASAPEDVEPAYSPALVSFVDIAAGAAVGAAVGFGIGAAVGWIPLGPREPLYIRRIA